MFVADDLGAWLIGLLAEAGRKKLTALALGSDQQRALRKAAADAVQDTAAEMNLSAEQARRLAMVIRKAFRKPVQDAPLAGSVTMLEVLQAGVVRQLAVPDDARRAAAGQSSVEVLGVPGAVLSEKLTGHLMREIMLRGSGGGPLAPLADQLNHDLTHLQCSHGWLPKAACAGLRAGHAIAVRVAEADPRRLGVHAAISVPGVSDEIPPEYVLRDIDDASSVSAPTVAAAAQTGRVRAAGGRVVGREDPLRDRGGKALLPDWWLVHPARRARSPRWRRRRRRGWWCGWMSCSATWTASTG